MVELAAVAVVIPVYNRRLKLIKTLQSVVAQSMLPSLLIIVDDGSTDGTAAAAKEWLTSNAPFEWRVITQPNGGVSAARNTGFAQIGELPFVCFLDSDDLWPREFIAEGLRAFDSRGDIVAAVADRVTERSGNLRPVQSLEPIQANPLLWLICNDGGILSCTMIRSSAARSAGLFVPGMLVSEDTDFLLRLFLQGGAVHSKAAPVVFVKKAPLEASEPLNLSHPTPERRYLWTRHLITSLAKLPQSLRSEHDRLIRTAVAQRWASVAFFSLKRGNKRLAVRSLLQAIWWDHDWRRRRRLVWSFARGRRAVLTEFSNPFAEPSSDVSPLSETEGARIPKGDQQSAPTFRQG